MAVRYNAETKTFLLETERSSYIMKVSRYGHLLHLYYGSRVPDEDLDYLLTYCDRGFSPNPYEAGNDRTYSLDFLPQEFSTVRGGDYRSPSVELIWGEGGTAFCGKVDGYEIKKRGLCHQRDAGTLGDTRRTGGNAGDLSDGSGKPGGGAAVLRRI